MTPEDAKGGGWIQALDPEDVEGSLVKMAKDLAKSGNYEGEFRLRTPLGKVLWVKANACSLYNDAGDTSGMIMTVSDITEDRKNQIRLQEIAEKDQLTGLVNRTFFNDRLDAALNGVARYGAVALLFMDLDDFKMINDTLGHDAGDDLLRDLAERLRDVVRNVDTIARLGGDEFTIILTHIREVSAVTLVANKIIESLAKPFYLGQKPIYVTASIGIALAENPEVSPKILLKQADLALYDAKACGRNQYKFHSPALDADANLNVYLRQSLKELGRKDFRLVFQPQVNAITGKIIGIESLARWSHPNVENVATGVFIRMIEDSGLINIFSAWLLEEAFNTVERWMRRSDKWRIPMSINLSAKQFKDKTLSKIIIGRCHAHGIPTDMIRFEVTESAFIDDPRLAAEILGDLRDAGFKIALDDFGTGYSSLVYLRNMPLHAIKIDRSFIQDVLEDKSDADIVRAIINLSKTLGFEVIAEGVDNAEVMQWLCDHGCIFQQGFHFCEPLECDVLEKNLFSSNNNNNILNMNMQL